jgi:hypothetical protein
MRGGRKFGNDKLVFHSLSLNSAGKINDVMTSENGPVQPAFNTSLFLN